MRIPRNMSFIKFMNLSLTSHGLILETAHNRSCLLYTSDVYKRQVQKYAHMAKEVQLIKCNTMYRTFAPEELISAELYGHWHVHTFDYNPVTCSLGIWTVE